MNQRHLLVNYLHDVKDILQLYDLSTGQLVRNLPLKVGTVCGVSCKKKHSEFFYKFTAFTTPGRDPSDFCAGSRNRSSGAAISL